MGIGYIQKEDRNLDIAPILYDAKTNEKVFVGIPPKQELYDYVSRTSGNSG